MGAVRSTHRGRDVVLGRPRVSPRVLGIAGVKAVDLLNSFPTAADTRDWLQAAVAQCNGNFGMALNDKLGCHDDRTEVLTDNGWKRWPDYDGSPVATMSQDTGMLEYQIPTKVIRYDYDGELFFADHKSLDFALTPNHRMYNRPYTIPRPYIAGAAGYQKEYQFDEIRSIAPRTAIPAAPLGHVGADFETIRIGERSWNGDDFIALLALVLSDGWAGDVSGSNPGAVSFCSFVDSRRDMVASFAHRLGIDELSGRCGVWKFTDRALSQWLYANACGNGIFKSEFKRIPRLVHSATMRQQEIFLRYFGDQSHASDEQQFYSSSKEMIDDIQELLLLTGKRGGIYARPMRNSPRAGAMDYTLSTWERDRVTMLAAGKKGNLCLDHYRGEVFCVEVPNSTLITRRNGQVLVSGNCCTVADGPEHCSQVWSANTGTMQTPPDSAVLAAYEKVCGYNPADPSTDQGGVETTVLAAWQAGIDGFAKLDIWIPVNPQNVEHCLTAIERYGAMYSGVALPLSAQNQAVWEVDDSDPAKAVAGSWGGHAASWSKYSRAAKQLACVTWGMEQGASFAWLGGYCDEAYAMLCSTLWAPNGTSPLGDPVAVLKGNITGLAS